MGGAAADGRYEIDPEAVAWREADGEIILLDLRSSTYLSTNESAAVLWQALAQGATCAELTDALSGHFAIPAETARADAEAFLTDCRSRGLVRARQEASR